MLCIHVISQQLMSHLFGRYGKKKSLVSKASPGFEPEVPFF